jgi:CheY-like chemotaxis protein
MRRTILLVDDTKTIRAVLRVLLGSKFDYLEAADGAEALRLAEENRPDLILMDITMPILDGVATLDELKQRESTRKIPVIMVTAENDGTTRARCKEHGAAGFVIKPLRWQSLHEVVRAWLPD